MKQSITITRRDNGYVLSVDGGSIECDSDAELMARIGMEVGMPYNKAQRQLFERMEAAEFDVKALEAECEKLKETVRRLAKENASYKAAIVRWFIRAFKEG